MTAYHLGQFWDSCLEQTNTSVVWSCASFKSLDVALQNNKEIIIDECLEMLNSQEEVNMATFDPQHAVLMSQNTDGWKTVWLKYFGKVIPRGQSKISDIVSHPIIYNTSISILEPGASIPPHVGQCQALVKFHFPLKIPEGECYMIYNGKKYYWTDRMLFNDCITHSVYNKTKERRVILLMDIIRPMPAPWNIINERVLSLAWWDPIVSKRYEMICQMSKRF